MVCWPFGKCALAFRIQCTRHRCQLAPSTRVMAWRNPSWASEITSLTPLRPRLINPLRNPDQNGSALARFLRSAIDADRYPLSPPLVPLKAILVKAGPKTPGAAGSVAEDWNAEPGDGPR